MQTRTISNREQNFKSLQAKGSINPQVLRDLVDFYRVPLVKAITRLNKIHKDTFATIAKEVFKNKISRQAVQQNYTEGK